MSELKDYQSGGARALVLLHERHLRSFVDTWFQAKETGVTLPKTKDPSYVSMEELLRHNLRAARGYMIWMCEKLGLPDPDIAAAPEAVAVAGQAREYMEHVLEKWREPLAEVPEERFEDVVYPSRWNVDYCIDAMMEHAVMHSIRHEFQLQRLMGE